MHHWAFKSWKNPCKPESSIRLWYLTGINKTQQYCFFFVFKKKFQFTWSELFETLNYPSLNYWGFTVVILADAINLLHLAKSLVRWEPHIINFMVHTKYPRFHIKGNQALAQEIYWPTRDLLANQGPVPTNVYYYYLFSIILAILQPLDQP